MYYVRVAARIFKETSSFLKCKNEKADKQKLEFCNRKKSKF